MAVQVLWVWGRCTLCLPTALHSPSSMAMGGSRPRAASAAVAVAARTRVSWQGPPGAWQRPRAVWRACRRQTRWQAWSSSTAPRQPVLGWQGCRSIRRGISGLRRTAATALAATARVGRQAPHPRPPRPPPPPHLARVLLEEACPRPEAWLLPVTRLRSAMGSQVGSGEAQGSLTAASLQLLCWVLSLVVAVVVAVAVADAVGTPAGWLLPSDLVLALPDALDTLDGVVACASGTSTAVVASLAPEPPV
mmetsp:Transcript_27668/g.89001  ORF Transcript_27668/g.89001 Transcript_27668/m.89001 type:complete len:249 (-) Transcript_27668:1848-2594(-)